MALYLLSLSFSLSKSKFLVIDKSFCCKILESMRLIFSKNVCLAKWYLRQWRRKWLVVSISWPQLQIEFKQSGKFCLNLWSAKWLKPSLILVSFKLSKFWVEEMLLESSLMNFSMKFYKYITRRSIANTDIKVIPFDYNCWEKGIF